MVKHLSANARKHRSCVDGCPDTASTVRVKLETPETFLAKQEERRKPPAGPEPATSHLKMRCVLDPTRRCKSYSQTAGHVSWLTCSDLLPSTVKEILGCEALEGYAFSVPKDKNSIRLYEWVSADSPTRIEWLTL